MPHCRRMRPRHLDVPPGITYQQSDREDLEHSQLVLTNTSTCHTFSADADGYGRADGVGALYLKRLSDAIQDNDPIRSVVCGTSVNSNGRTPGIALPSSMGQEAVIAKAYSVAGLSGDATGYVECQGTDTPVGDPIKVDFVSRFYSKASQRYVRTG